MAALNGSILHCISQRFFFSVGYVMMRGGPMSYDAGGGAMSYGARGVCVI